MLDPATWAFIRDLGFGGLAAFALIGGYRGWYVWRREFEDMKASRDYYRELVRHSMGQTDSAIEVVAAKAKDG